MKKEVKVKCENCGSEWFVSLGSGWTILETPYGVALYSSNKIKHKNPLIDSQLLRCSGCNRQKTIRIIRENKKPACNRKRERGNIASKYET